MTWRHSSDQYQTILQNAKVYLVSLKQFYTEYSIHSFFSIYRRIAGVKRLLKLSREKMSLPPDGILDLLALLQGSV